MSPAEVRRLLDDAKPRAPLLPDGKIPMRDGRCAVCGVKPRPFAPGSDDHDDDCAAEREWWRWRVADLALSQAAPAIAAAYLALAEGDAP